MHVPDPTTQRLKAETEAFYKSIGAVRCPYFGSDVQFNEMGWEHLIAKSDRRMRTSGDFAIRARLLKRAMAVITRSGTLQEYTLREQFVRKQRNQRWHSHVRPVEYFCFTALIDDFRLNVVVRRVDGGLLHFFSVYPAKGKRGFEQN